MKTVKKLRPGQPGTLKWLKKYGDDLVCIRYREDPEGGRKLKTIEIIIEQSSLPCNLESLPMDNIVSIRIAYGEFELAKRIEAAGGRWNHSKKVWELAYKDVLKLGLLDRIVAPGE